jgi:tRNA(fMet)-specific endonuclease VapC
VARLILDSEVLIATERAGKHLNGVIADDDDVAIAAISAAELLVGVNLADPAHRDKRTAFVRSVLDTIPIEVYDLSVARAHAGLLAHVRRTGRPRGAHDLIIAATAVATDRIVVSGDSRAYADLPGVSVRS